MRIWTMMLCGGLLLCNPLTLQGQPLTDRAPSLRGLVNEDALQRFHARGVPLVSADGTISVRSLSPERTQYRFPVLRFADTARRNFSEAVFPVGSRESPLAIELGTQTNLVTTIERRSFRTGDGFSQLILRIPNPDTVDLDELRVGIIEAQLRERARAEKGSYAALKWPRWLIEAMVNLSRNGEWRANAYETARGLYDAGQFPSVDDFFVPDAPPPQEAVATFFALWLLEQHAAQPEVLLVAPWQRFAVLGLTADGSWETWFLEQETTIFMPGLLTRSQFKRWKANLREPKSLEDAHAITQRLTRDAMGKPQAFCDLTMLYLKAYGAYLVSNESQYRVLRQQADEASKVLEIHFEHHPLLVTPSEKPAEGFSLSPSTSRGTL